jgi:hypothetical protein
MSQRKNLKNSLLYLLPRSRGFPVNLSLGSLNSLVFSYQGVVLDIRDFVIQMLQSSQNSLQGQSVSKSTKGYFSFLMTCALCLKNTESKMF